MAVFANFSKLFITNVKCRLPTNNNCAICVRLLSHQSIEYSDNPDPRPIFIKKQVQMLLKTLTRTDIGKVYRKRKLGEKTLEPPVYKFMTDEQLQEVLNEAKAKVDDMLQIPPIVPVRKTIDSVYCKDPALQGLDTSKFIFTDISYGVRDADRLIIVRETDGTLRAADWDTRTRMTQLYFPVEHRSLKEPKMFEDENLQNLLDRKEYVFVLDRTCMQFEPNDPKFQKICSVTYQHLNEKGHYDILRSTRHFGALSFFLVWNKMADNLLLDLINSDKIEEINALVELYSQIHGIQFQSDGNLKSAEEYIKKYSSKKAVLELAIEGCKERIKQQNEYKKDIQRAHGLS